MLEPRLLYRTRKTRTRKQFALLGFYATSLHASAFNYPSYYVIHWLWYAMWRCFRSGGNEICDSYSAGVQGRTGMIQLALFLFIGVLLLASLLILARRTGRPEGGAEALLEARQALKHLQSELLPPELVERFFAAEDFEFVASAAPPAVNALFRRERKKMVLTWIGQVRQQIRSLRRFHLGTARFYARLSFRSEIMLAIDFGRLLIACRALQLLVYIGGARVAPRMMGATAAVGRGVCEITEHALAFLIAPSQVERSIAS